MFKSSKKAASPKAVVFYSYPKLLFCWPLILLGVLLYYITSPETGDGRLAFFGWVYLLAAFFVVLTVSVDIERNYAAFWLVFFGLFFFLGRWLQDVQGFTLFGDVYTWFADLEVRHNRDMGLAMSVLLGIPYLVMMFWARVQHKWRVTHNEFEHYSWGRADDSLARGAKRVRTTYPDLLELILAGAGTMIVYSATGRTELRRINHVPLLFLLRRKLDTILESKAVTITQQEAINRDAAAEAEAEEEERSERLEGETTQGPNTDRL